MLEDIIVRVRIDGVKFEANISPDGHYSIWGPVWRDQPVALLTQGKLASGIIFTGLVGSIGELVRVKLKS